MKVVRESQRLADVCIWSRAWASCSLSMVELPEMEAKEPRRFRKLVGEPSGWEGGSSGGFEVVLLAIFGAAVLGQRMPSVLSRRREAVAKSAHGMRRRRRRTACVFATAGAQKRDTRHDAVMLQDQRLTPSTFLQERKDRRVATEREGGERGRSAGAAGGKVEESSG